MRKLSFALSMYNTIGNEFARDSDLEESIAYHSLYTNEKIANLNFVFHAEVQSELSAGTDITGMIKKIRSKDLSSEVNYSKITCNMDVLSDSPKIKNEWRRSYHTNLMLKCHHLMKWFYAGQLSEDIRWGSTKACYLGTDYYGYQIQHGVPTIEGKLLRRSRMQEHSRTSQSKIFRRRKNWPGVHALVRWSLLIRKRWSDKARNNQRDLHHIWIYASTQVGKDSMPEVCYWEGIQVCFLGKGLDMTKWKTLLLYSQECMISGILQMKTGKSTLCDIEGYLSGMMETGFIWISREQVFAAHGTQDRLRPEAHRKGEKEKACLRRCLTVINWYTSTDGSERTHFNERKISALNGTSIAIHA